MPGMMTLPVASSTLAPAGIETLPSSPRATILPPWITRTPCAMGGAVMGRIRAPRTTSTLSSWAVWAGAEETKEESTPPKSNIVTAAVFLLCIHKHPDF